MKKTALFLILITLINNVNYAASVVPYFVEDPKKEERVLQVKTVKQDESGYSTGIGFRGGFTSGLTVKHFIGSNSAIEGILGTRYHGFSLTGLYELHKNEAFEVPNLTWEYGLGGRIGFYDSYYYHWKNDKYHGNVMTLGVVGILGLEYQFDEIPFTVSLDIMPFINFIGWGNQFIDGSISIRYVLK